MKKNPKCLLWGGYGYGNVGDELTLAAAIGDMRVLFGDSIAILSPLPGYTMALFPEEKVVPYQPLSGRAPKIPNRSIPECIWMKGRRCLGLVDPILPPKTIKERIGDRKADEWVRLIEGADLLYLVGGGYLTDLFSLERFLTPVEVAHHFGVRVATAPLGIGPLRLKESREYFKSSMERVALRVRDPESLEECKNLGVDAEMCRDDGFRVRENLDFPNVESRGVIGVNYFPQHGAADQLTIRRWWLELLIGLKQKGLQVEGFCFHNKISSDFSNMVELFSEVGFPAKSVCFPDFDFRTECRRLVGYNTIITSRFHAAVVANVMKIPTIAIASGPYYLSKMAVAVKGAEMAQVIDPLAVSPSEQFSLIQSWSDF